MTRWVRHDDRAKGPMWKVLVRCALSKQVILDALS